MSDATPAGRNGNGESEAGRVVRPAGRFELAVDPASEKRWGVEEARHRARRAHQPPRAAAIPLPHSRLGHAFSLTPRVPFGDCLALVPQLLSPCHADLQLDAVALQVET